MWLESGASYLALIAEEKRRTTSRAIPGRRIFILREGISIADGFSLPCSAPWARTQTPPYKGVVTPGWTLDEKGQAMSKSRGNDVDPLTSPSRLGGEVVRLWVASVDFREDVVGSEALMQRVARELQEDPQYAFATSSATSGDFDPAKDAVPFDQMEPLDQYMLRQTVAFADDVRKCV